MTDFRECFCPADTANHAPVPYRLMGENASKNLKDLESDRLY